MFATRHKAASGYLLQYGDTNIWLDAGAGTWRNLLQHIEYRDLHGVVITHRHPDHTTDVFQAMHARRYGQAEPLPQIPLWAPAETIATLEAFSTDLEEAFEVRPVTAGDVVGHGGARFSFHSMAHPPETVGVRVEYEGGVFAYSSDTGPGADFSELAKDADLFICEATYQDSDGAWEGHMHATDAARIAAQNDVHQLVLTHLPPDRDLGLSIAEAEREAGGVKVQLADDGQVFEVMS